MNRKNSLRGIIRYEIRCSKSIACLFDDYFCEEWEKRDQFKRNNIGYIVMDKPKYRPGDTLRMKAYILTKKGKPIDEPIWLKVGKYGTKNTALKIMPIRPGVFNSEIILHDSLELKLDYHYTLALINKDGFEYLNRTFEYEDYILQNNTFTFDIDKGKYYKGDSITLEFTTKDANGNYVPDTRVEISLLPTSVDAIFKDTVQIPDSLHYVKKQLNTRSLTQVKIPCDIFSACNMHFNIDVKFLTSDNEIETKTQSAIYYFKHEEVRFTDKDSMLVIEYTENNESATVEGILIMKDSQGRPLQEKQIQLPFKLHIDPLVAQYSIQTQTIYDSIDMHVCQPKLRCYSKRTRDSVLIKVNNPRKLKFNYFIYKSNREVDRGCGTSLNYATTSNLKARHFISLQYIWAGRVVDEDYEVPLAKVDLNVTMNHPKYAVPGQDVTIKVNVKDHKGKPAKNVDLTVHGLTSKFDFTPPDLPSKARKWSKAKSVVNDFTKQQAETLSLNRLLMRDYLYKIGIDTIEYFRFIFPKDTLYKSSYQMPDSITQFAPFVFKDGIQQEVKIIYVDDVPVYFNWMDDVNPYSFKIDTFPHKISIRTRNNLISNIEIQCDYGEKNIFSIDVDNPPHNVIVEEMPAQLEYYEHNRIDQYILPVFVSPQENYLVLKQGDVLRMIKPKHNYWGIMNCGPFKPYQEIEYHIMDSFTQYFMFEPYYEYEISYNQIKMKCSDGKSYIPPAFSEQGSFDSVISQSSIKIMWEDHISKKRIEKFLSYDNIIQPTGTGKLQILGQQHSFIPLNIILVKFDTNDYYRLFRGNTKSINNLSPGEYKMVVLVSGDRYFEVDSIEIEPNFTTCLKLKDPLEYKYNAFSTRVAKYIKKRVQKNTSVDSVFEEQVLKSYFIHYSKKPKGANLIHGKVTDFDGTEIPGVNVVIKGTTSGTITDLDGNYSLEIPWINAILQYSFVGYRTKEISVGKKNIINVSLDVEGVGIDEVVVVGYGMQKKSDVTGCIVSVTSESMMSFPHDLQGRAAGLMVSGNAGATNAIRIRGINGINPGSEPLYVIDGIIGGDISIIDPDKISSMEVLKDASTAIYGARAANGVVIVSTKGGSYAKAFEKPVSEKEAFMNEMMQQGSRNSIRQNFSDVAFWEPDLVTDENGNAEFTVQLPDDITKWDTWVYAMNTKLQSGTASGNIKSMQPIAVQLAAPSFLVEGDSTAAIGKITNYMPDSVQAATSWQVNDSIVHESAIKFNDYSLDTFVCTASTTDTMSLSYQMTSQTGFFDGEKYNIPVVLKGVEIATGNAYVLNGDTTLTVAVPEGKTIEVSALSGLADVIYSETRHIIQYRYLCNEQMASKLIALLTEKRLAAYAGEMFKYDKHIKKLIRKLEKHQNANGLWGWWNNSETRFWVSLHVYEALMLAKEDGYEMDLNTDALIHDLQWRIHKETPENATKIIRLLYLAGINTDYNRLIKAIETDSTLKFSDRLSLMEIQQMLELPFSVDSLLQYKKETALGNVYFWDDHQQGNLQDNKLIATYYACKILNQQGGYESLLQKIQNYVFESRVSGHWQNTYESTYAIRTLQMLLTPDELENKKVELSLQGGINKAIDTFPQKFAAKTTADSVSITKKGLSPVYLTFHEDTLVETENDSTELFGITTTINFADSTIQLIAGEETGIDVEINVKKDANYVMLEVPVPAGAHYVEKENYSYPEIHREYFKTHVSIFSERLHAGKYKFHIDFIPRYSGIYTVNPAKVQLMYYPLKQAWTKIRKIKVR